MRFRLIIDERREEEISAIVHHRSTLTDEIAALVAGYESSEELTGYSEDDVAILKLQDVECFFVEDGRTFAVYSDGRRYRIRKRLYEVESSLGPDFVRINKSTIANWKRVSRFRTSIAGAVDMEFQSGHTDYVSRRCFAQIRRRYAL